MIEKYKFERWNKEGFSVELDALGNELNFYLEDILINNIELFFEKFSNIKINFYRSDEIDLILLRKVRKFFLKNFKLVSFIKFVDFSQEELRSFLGDEVYFKYCYDNSISVLRYDELILSEKLKLEKFSENMMKYNEFLEIFKFFNSSDKYMYWNFPIEKELDRFVFYFLVLTQEDKDEVLNLFSKINLDSQIYDLIFNKGILKDCGMYAVGFNYKDEKLVRSTLYSRFYSFSPKEKNELFLKKFFNLNCENFSGIIKDWGFDVFEDNSSTFKIYFKEKKFDRNLNSKLGEILKNKSAVQCLKFKDGVICDEKFEFSNNLFSREEIIILKSMKIYDEKSKLFSVYLNKNGEIVNSVSYNL